MDYNDVAKLVAQTLTRNEVGDAIPEETCRQVFVKVSSIGLKRKMEALSAGLKLEWKFTLADVAEYNGEEIIEYKGQRYNIVNVYTTDVHSVELTTAKQ